MAIATAPMHAEAIAAADMRGIGAAGAVRSARGQATTIATMAQVKSTVTSGYDAGVPRYATDRSGQANIRTASAKIACVPGVQVRDMCVRPSMRSRRERETEGVQVQGVTIPLILLRCDQRVLLQQIPELIVVRVRERHVEEQLARPPHVQLQHVPFDVADRHEQRDRMRRIRGETVAPPVDLRGKVVDRIAHQQDASGTGTDIADHVAEQVLQLDELEVVHQGVELQSARERGHVQKRVGTEVERSRSEEHTSELQSHSDLV